MKEGTLRKTMLQAGNNTAAQPRSQRERIIMNIAVNQAANELASTDSSPSKLGGNEVTFAYQLCDSQCISRVPIRLKRIKKDC